MIFLGGCATMFPRYCDEQVRFKFKKPIILNLSEGKGIPLFQTEVSEYTQVAVYTGWLKDSVVFGSTNRRNSYCVYNSSADSLQIYVEPNSSYILKDSVNENHQSYFPVYFFNPGPDMFLCFRNKISTRYQIKTELGWLNIDQFIISNMECKSEPMYQLALYPGEVLILLFGNRTGPDKVQSRICIDNNCSEIFESKIDLKALLPIQRN